MCSGKEIQKLKSNFVLRRLYIQNSAIELEDYEELIGNNRGTLNFISLDGASVGLAVDKLASVYRLRDAFLLNSLRPFVMPFL